MQGIQELSTDKHKLSTYSQAKKYLFTGTFIYLQAHLYISKPKLGISQIV